jgi:protein SCO1/2
MVLPLMIVRRSLLFALLSSALLSGVGAATSTSGNAPAPAWPGGNDYQRSMRSYSIPDVVLVDADAHPVRLRELLATDDAVMLNFVFTTCNAICPIMVRVFADVPERLGPSAQKVRMISISIDPDNDTPAQLRSYSKNFAGNKRWTFLTGRLQDVKSVQLAFDSYRGDKMNHEPLTLIRAAAGKPWLRIDGFASPDDLVREYQKVQSR